MQAYRDQYARLFNDGRNVVVMGISNDSPEELRSWLFDADFPFVFASAAGTDGAPYASFGLDLRGNGMPGSRAVIVVGPDGRIAGVIPQFRQVDPAAYDELAEMVDSVTPEPEEG